MLSLRSLIVLLSLTSSSLGTASTYSQLFCVTKIGKSSVKSVPSSTSTTTLKFPAYVFTTITPIKTITPPPITTTSTVYTTSTTTETAPTQTDTYTATQTSFVTSTSTDVVQTTSTETDTTTSTQVGGTTTVPAPAGFIPETSGDPSPMKKRSLAHERRQISGKEISAKKRSNVLEDRDSGKSYCTKPPGGKPSIVGAKTYPTAVSCKKVVEIVSTSTLTITAKKTATTTIGALVITQQSTSTITSTSTYIPVDASTTTTLTEVDTISTDTTTTSTQTQTVTNTVVVLVSPTATYYAACAANNIRGSAYGSGIGGLEVEGNFAFGSAASAYDCCAQCITNPNCAGSGYSADGSCIYVLPLSCPGGQVSPIEYDSGGEPPNSDLFISNGPCGIFTNGFI